MTTDDDVTIDPTDPTTDSSATDPSATDPSATSGSSESTGGSPIDLDGWTRRVPLTITNELATDLDDHQVFVAIEGDDDMEADFADLRFTDADSAMAIPHWFEYLIVPVEAGTWIRVPHIPANGSVDVWMYYGNPAAASTSDGDAAMVFADDFETGALDAAKWGATDQYDINGGVLSILTGSVYSQDPVIEEDLIVQFRVEAPCCEQAPYIYNFMSAQARDMSINNQFLRLEGSQLVVQYLDADNVGPPNATFLGFLQQDYFRDFGLARTAGQAHFRNFLPENTLSYGADMDGDHYIVLGHYQGGSAGTDNVADINLDAVFVRRFAIEEPTVAIGNEEIWP